MGKPLILALKEAKVNIAESINAALRSGVPGFVLEPVIAELHTQVSKLAQAEYDRARRDVEAEEAKAKETEEPEAETTEETGGEDDGH